MKFMKEVGDGEISLEQGADAENWSEEYLSVAARENSDNLAQNWANEHTTDIGSNFKRK